MIAYTTYGQWTWGWVTASHHSSPIRHFTPQLLWKALYFCVICHWHLSCSRDFIPLKKFFFTNDANYIKLQSIQKAHASIERYRMHVSCILYWRVPVRDVMCCGEHLLVCDNDHITLKWGEIKWRFVALITTIMKRDKENHKTLVCPGHLIRFSLLNTW